MPEVPTKDTTTVSDQAVYFMFGVVFFLGLLGGAGLVSVLNTFTEPPPVVEENGVVKTEPPPVVEENGVVKGVQQFAINLDEPEERNPKFVRELSYRLGVLEEEKRKKDRLKEIGQESVDRYNHEQDILRDTLIDARNSKDLDDYLARVERRMQQNEQRKLDTCINTGASDSKRKAVTARIDPPRRRTVEFVVPTSD